MTTATSQLFGNDKPARATDTMSPLLSVLAVILGVNLRESLAVTSAQDDASYFWGL